MIESALHLVDLTAVHAASAFSASPHLTLAWKPFVSPMPHPGAMWWLLAIPLVVAVSMIWKATRLTSLERFWISVTIMTFQVLAGMAALTLGLMLLVRVIVPLLPVG